MWERDALFLTLLQCEIRFPPPSPPRLGPIFSGPLPQAADSAPFPLNPLWLFCGCSGSFNREISRTKDQKEPTIHRTTARQNIWLKRLIKILHNNNKFMEIMDRSVMHYRYFLTMNHLAWGGVWILVVYFTVPKTILVDLCSNQFLTQAGVLHSWAGNANLGLTQLNKVLACMRWQIAWQTI